MTSVLCLFLDGVGLGDADARINPFIQARLPNLDHLIGDQALTLDAAPFHGPYASLLALDANLGLSGSPLSASGQATLLTGRNVPQEIGGHYGPKPNPEIAAILREDNLFKQVIAQGGKTALLNAYPPGYFEGIESGRRLFSAIPLALDAAGIPLMNAEDLRDGNALSVDFTGEKWSAQPGFPQAPIYTLQQAGELLANLSRRYDLAWFDFWPSDYAGHRREMDQAVELLESFDTVFGALVNDWDSKNDLILLTSDHGNLEDLSQRQHTRNPVPCILIGPVEIRTRFANELKDLTDVAPVIRSFLGLPDPRLE
ncbi:MAG: peptidase [Anaerolineales bacterium]|nr:MAG: peptidase [Anaerolineales bacterium]